VDIEIGAATSWQMSTQEAIAFRAFRVGGTDGPPNRSCGRMAAAIRTWSLSTAHAQRVATGHRSTRKARERIPSSRDPMAAFPKE